MINIIGIALTFIGTILTLLNVIASKSNKQNTTYADLQKISPDQYKNRLFSIYGLIIMAIGFALQFYSAIILL